MKLMPYDYKYKTYKEFLAHKLPYLTYVRDCT